MDATFNNAWIDSYLDALLARGGLSQEHVASGGSNLGSSSDSQRFAADDSERSITARYYVHSLLSLDEDKIRNAWGKAQRPARSSEPQAERDARMQYLSWRIWGMKRRKAAVEAEMANHYGYTHEDIEEGDEGEEVDEVDATTLRTLNDLSVRLQQQIHEEEEEIAREPSLAHGLYNSKPAQQQQQAKQAARAASGTQQQLSIDIPSFQPGQEVHTRMPQSPFSTPRGVDAAAAAVEAAGGRISTGGAGGTLTAPATPSHLNTAQTSITTPLNAPDPLLISRFPRLYLVLISLHGLVRGEKMELGRDPDTGGQVKYVVELAKAMGRFPSVARVDLLTRLICDPSVDKSYGVPEERLQLPGPPGEAKPTASALGTPLPSGDYGAELQKGSGDVNGPANAVPPAESPTGAFIVRLAAGDPQVYLRKEDLWPHVREFADRAIAHIQSTLQRLQDSGEGPVELYMIHGHYADAGEVAALVSQTLGVECVLTGHSLGRNKREHLLKSGTMSVAEVEAAYKIGRRIEAEERALDAASVVFTSTQEEVAKQWGTYDGYSDELSAALQLRPCRGYHVPRMAVIPPGLDFSNLKVSLPEDPWEAVLGPNYASMGAGGPGTPLLSPNSSVRRTTRNSHGTKDFSSGAVGDAPAPANHDPTKPPRSSFDMSGAPATPPRPGNNNRSAAPSPRSSFAGAPPPGAIPPSSPRDRSPVRRPGGMSSGGAPPGSVPGTARAGQVGPALSPEPTMWQEIARFLRAPGKPVILAMCRPDPKKNVLGLLRAYGQSRVLKDLANLVLILGNREVIDSMAPGSARVMESVLKLVDAYDLYGSVAIPKKHTQADISDIYLLAAATRGVFVNVALQEPFGLTLIEAAAHGVPILATTHGGPVDIVATLKNGVLVEPTDTRAITDALISMITSPRTWDELAESGRRHITAYSWPSHCARALRTVEDQKATLQAANRSRLGGAIFNHTPLNQNAGNGNGPQGGGFIRHTLSLSYDDLGSLARAIAASTAVSKDSVIRDAMSSVAAAAAKAEAAPAAAAAAAPAKGDRDSVAPAPAGPTDAAQPADASATPAKDASSSSPEAPRTPAPESSPDAASAAAQSSTSSAAVAAPKVCGGSQQQPVHLHHHHHQARSFSSASQQYHHHHDHQHQHHLQQVAAGAGEVEVAKKLARQSIELARSARSGSLPAGGLNPLFGSTTLTSRTGRKPTGRLHIVTTSGAAAHAAATAPESDMPSVEALDEVSGRGGAPAGSSRSSSRSATAGMLAGVVGKLGAGGHTRNGSRGAGVAAMEPLHEHEGEETAGAAAGSTHAAGEGGAPSTPSGPLVYGSLGQHTPAMLRHEHYAVLSVDSPSDLAVAAPLIHMLLRGKAAAPEGVDASGSSLQLATTAASLILSSASSSESEGGSSVGVGIMCAWSAKEMRAMLTAQGIDPCSLDFMVCNAGSLVWHTTRDLDEADAQAQQEVAFACDDDWERHLEGCSWDDRVVGQVLRRIISSKVGWGRLFVVRDVPGAAAGVAAGAANAASKAASMVTRGLASVVAATSRAMGKAANATGAAATSLSPDANVPPAGAGAAFLAERALSNASPSGGRSSSGDLKGQAGPAPGSTPIALTLSSLSTPLHFMIQCEVLGDADSAGAGAAGGNKKGTKPMGVSEAAIYLLATIRRKLRLSGLRAQLNLTPGAPGNASTANAANTFTLHVTPLRCSRALALRHLANRFRKPMDDAWTVVGFTAATGAKLASSSPSGSVISADTDLPSASMARTGSKLAKGAAGRTPDAAAPAGSAPAMVGMHASDGEDVVAGMQKVILLPSSSATGVAFPIDVAAYSAVAVAAEGEAQRPQDARVVVITEPSRQ